MISIFNGRERTLGGSQSEIYAQVSVDFRRHLHILKGARLAVFLAIALHANRHGWAWPSRKLLARETGYNEQTISRALTELCAITINDQRLLLRHQTARGNGTFDTNQYLIFPSPHEVARYENSQPELPCIHLPYTVEPSTVEPSTVEPSTENVYTNDNHDKEEPCGKGDPEEEADPAAGSSPSPLCSIHNVPMQLRTKDGQTWFSHKLPDGTWCKGAPNDPHSLWEYQIRADYAEIPY